MKALYTTNAVSTGGRDGKAVIEGKHSFDMALPVEIGGNGKGMNPEQLFAAGYAACFHGALKLAAKNLGAKITSSEVSAQVSLLDDNGGFAIGVALSSRIGGVDAAKADEIMALAHTICPYSKATRGNIEVTLSAEAV
ncbi:MAG: organic hydroperoxide resistance protein [Eubacteriales bacterium]